MSIYYSPYRLERLNGEKFQKGTLVKLVEGDYWGVADICPHTNLGDDDFKTEIKNRGRLYERAVELAREDLSARKNKISLLNDKKVRNNHLIFFKKNQKVDFKVFRNECVKIKISSDLLEEAVTALNEINFDIKLRIDFNNQLTAAEFDFFLNSIGSAVLSKIEYIEDPLPLAESWTQWNKKIRLAYDFQSRPYDKRYAQWRIVKASRESVPEEPRETMTFTSAMEHPVGFAHALRIAQKLAVNESGFSVLALYKKDAFSKYFIHDGAFVNFSSEALADFGIGMTEELNKLQWLSEDDLLNDQF